MKNLSLYKIENLPKTNEKNVSEVKTNMFMTQKFMNIILLIALAMVMPMSLLKAQAPDKSKIRTVVIDPGHGGSDPGAVGKISKEKDIALDVSLKFGKMIEDKYKDVKVIYTRTDDSFVELYKRAKIANDNNADIFICIHVNASTSSSPYGAETFVMGLHVNDANLKVAKLENSVILKEDNYEEQYGGFDPNDPENHIIFSLFQNANLTQSLFFAGKVQDEIRDKIKRYDRGVKQAGFLVLWRTTMPSVLVELGFISNLAEEKYLNSAEGQNNMAVALFDAFKNYKDHYEDNIGEASEIINQTNSIQNTNQAEGKLISETNKPEASNPEPENPKSQSELENEKGVFFKVQVMASSQKIEINSPKFISYQNVNVYLHNGVYKYTIGKETDYKKIVKLQNELKSEFEGCFIVAFKNGERFPLNQARSELGQ
ncbi:MAG: N-acetylmuramoyl-L-alanine amidase [Bacteroidales bacterium]|nr:N-acetylmuramoyl-L-alanine amidase [Bacteroidales bacterium]